jgi:hypothetical protein
VLGHIIRPTPEYRRTLAREQANEPDARSSVVHEYEPGVEWAFAEDLEITAAYTFADRLYRDSVSPDNHQYGRFRRLQAQVSF